MVKKILVLLTALLFVSHDSYSAFDKPAFAQKDYIQLVNKSINRDDVNLMESLIKDGINVEITNRRGETPLMMAIKRKRLGIIELLLKSGVNVNTQDKNADKLL